MRLGLFTTSIVLLLVAAAYAQPASRMALGAVARVEGVFIEGDARGGTAVAGVITTARLSKTFSVEAELTRAWNRIERSYEGWFVSYAQGPNLTREEIERLAPVARRTLGYSPGIGGSAAFVTRGQIGRRVSLAARVGLSARRYVETSSFTILSIPEGVDPGRVARDPNFQDSSHRRTRGGLLVGVDVSAAVTDRLNVAPELRFVYSGPARIGDKYRELGLGARGTWRF